VTSSRAGLRPAHKKAASSWTKTCVCTSCACCRPNEIPLLSNLLLDRLASGSQAGERNGIWSRTGLRPVSEQDSIVEYGPNRSVTRFELSRYVEIARICLRKVGNQVCDLDSMMKFSQSRSQTSSQTSSRAMSRAR